MEHAEAWQNLVHVCQRWRNIIYGSPRHLNLHLFCSLETPFRENACWPKFPLILDYHIIPEEDDDDVICALEHPDRVRYINISIEHLDIRPSDSMAHAMLGAMLVPFPALTHLDLTAPYPPDGKPHLDLTDEFLGMSAPRLQHIHLHGVSFPALPALLSSARSLVCLELSTLVHGDSYIPPEAMIGGLAGLTSLMALSINFLPSDDEPSHSDEEPEKEKIKLPAGPPIRAELPALMGFDFTGENEYLEALIAQIDSPRVEVVTVDYLTPVVETRQFSQFIGRTASLESAWFRRAEVTFKAYLAEIKLDRAQGGCHQARLSLSVAKDHDENYHLPGLLGQLAPMLSNVNHLSIMEWSETGYTLENAESFFHLFPAVETMRVSGRLAVKFASMLEDIACSKKRATDVLPALRLLHWSDSNEPVSTEQFLALRRLSGHPVTVINTKDKLAERSEDEDDPW